MKKSILSLILTGAMAAQGQVINSVTTSPNPLECQSWTITVSGTQPMPQFYIQSDSYTVNGTIINVSLDFNAPPIGNPLITPYTHVITIPANAIPSGSYQLNVSAFSIPLNQTTSSSSVAMTIGSCCPAAANFSISDSLYCWNDTIFVTDQSTGTTNVEWWVNGTLSHSGIGDFYLTDMSGAIEIKQVAIDTACTDTLSHSVYVAPKTAFGFSVVQVGHVFTFTSAGSGTYTFDWDFGDGNTDIGSLVTHTFADDGDYNVCLTTTDDNGCKADSCMTVTYSTISFDKEILSLRIYPNPARDYLTIEKHTDTPVHWYNRLGQEVQVPMRQGSRKYLHIYDLNGLTAGCYYIQWDDQAHKVIVE